MYHFFKHNNEWRYRAKNSHEAKSIDTFALEQVLGVVGGPEVIVIRDVPEPYTPGQKLNIHVVNGFVTKAVKVGFCHNDHGGLEQEEDEVYEFTIEGISL